MVKPEILDFLGWMFLPENKVFVKNSNPSVVARHYKDQTGKSITPGTVAYNLYKWLKINDKFYDIEKMPMCIFKMDVFKEFAIENHITIEDMNGSIWEKESNTDQKESIDDEKESVIDQKESTIDQKETLVEDDQIGK